MRKTIVCLALFFIIGAASAQTANPNYDEMLAKSLNADDYGMLVNTDPAIKAKLLSVDLYEWYGSAALAEYLPVSDKIWKVEP